MHPMRLNLWNSAAPVARAAILLGVLLLSGCASQGVPKSDQESQPAAGSPTASPAVVAPAVTGDNGTVIFFRDKKFVGGAISFKVREAEQELGKLGNGTYFTAVLPVGAHAFDVYSEAKDVLNLEVEKGETYYVQGSISFGVLVGRPNLAPSDAATFASLKDKLKDSGAEAAAKAAKQAARASRRKGSR